MADPLEEKILAQAERLRDAIEDPEPRKYGEVDPTDIDEDALEDDVAAGADGDDDDDDDDGRGAGRGMTAQGVAGAPQTGVKGVLADYKHRQRQDSVKRREDAQRLSEQMKRVTLSNAPAAMADDDDDELLLDEDDEFMREYEAKRVGQLKNGPRTVFGAVTGVNDDGFLRVVEKDYPGVPVIVHLTDPASDASRRMNACLVEVAQRFAYAKFVWYSARAAGFDRDVLPVLLVYRNGELQQSLVHTVDETGDEFTADDIEALLQRHHAISNADRASIERPSATRKLAVSKAPRPADADDDD